MNRNRWWLWVAGLTCTATVLGYAARWLWLGELACHFRVQYAWILAASCVWFVIRQRRWQAATVGMCAVLNLILIMPVVGESRATASGVGPSLRVLSFNVNYANTAYEGVRRLIDQTSPDVVLLPEAGHAWWERVDVADRYPFFTGATHGKGHSIVLASRLPFEHAEVVRVGRAGFPSVVARFDLAGTSLTILGTHPYAPMTPSQRALRNEQLLALANLARQQSGSVMLFGDLNTTSWSPIFQDVLRVAGLRDSREGFGLQPSWPTWFPPFWITIDHCLVSPNITVTHRAVGSHIGSDHYPLLVEISLKP